jgi:hypothetical protein
VEEPDWVEVSFGEMRVIPVRMIGDIKVDGLLLVSKYSKNGESKYILDLAGVELCDVFF